MCRNNDHTVFFVDRRISVGDHDPPAPVDTGDQDAGFDPQISKRNANVSATIYTKQTAEQFRLDVQRHNQQYPPITINVCQHNHDRFLIIDDVVYLFGASLKDAGKKLFAYIKMQETSASELLSRIR